MATTTRETIVANPARKASGKMTAKQIKFFGTKRQKAALKAKRKRAKPAAKKHRARTKPNPSRKRKRSVVRSTPVAAPKKRKRKSGAKRRATKRKNPGAIYALMNPARKGQKSMARTKKRQRKNPAGYTKKRRNPARRQARRSNPGAFGKPMDWLSLGGGAIAGGLAATYLPQQVLGSSNTGAIGYLASAASTALLAVATHMVLKRTPSATAGVIAGGAGALIRRILSDKTSLGSLLSDSGMGDYLANFDFKTPQIIGGNGNTSLGTAGTTPVSVAGAPSYGRALANI